VDIKKMINSYAEWLKSEITITDFGEYVEITTPYLDRFNDYLQIYAKQDKNGTITLTDDGYIIGNLISGGMTFRTNSKRKNELERIIRTYSLALNEEEITVTTSMNDFPRKKHMMVSAMLAIDDMFLISSDSVKNFFIEDVQNYFDANSIYYSKDFSLQGKTGNLYTYDFHFQRTLNKPERFCKGINRLSNSNRDATLFNWVDTQEKRNNNGELIVLLNDEYDINSELVNGFYNYGVKVAKFSERQSVEVLNMFTA